MQQRNKNRSKLLLHEHQTKPKTCPVKKKHHFILVYLVDCMKTNMKCNFCFRIYSFFLCYIIWWYCSHSFGTCGECNTFRFKYIPLIWEVFGYNKVVKRAIPSSIAMFRFKSIRIYRLQVDCVAILVIFAWTNSCVCHFVSFVFHFEWIAFEPRHMITALKQ